MMKPIIDFTKQVVSLTSDMKQCKIDIKELEPGAETEPRRPKFDLADLISRMPADYQAVEEGFGPPVGKETW